MSFIEICLKFDEVIKYLSGSMEETTNISKFFSSYKKIVESFSSNLSRLSDTIKVNTNPESNFTTLSMALLSLKDHIKFVSESNLLLVKNLQLDIIEPLNLFTEHCFRMYQDLKNKGLEVYKSVSISKERLNKQKTDYYKIASEYEKINRLPAIEENREKQESFSKHSQKLLQNQEIYLNRYIESIMDANKLWDEYDRKMPQIMEDLQQNEESRIYFIRNSLEKYTKYCQKFENNLIGNLEKFGEIISNINSILDIRVFVDLHKSKDQVYREIFVNYDEYKASLSQKEEPEKDEKNIGNTFNQLLAESSFNRGSGINSDSFSKLSQLIENPEGRKMFIESLTGNSSRSLLSLENITQIAALIKEMLSIMIKESEYDALNFYMIVEISNTFFTIENERKKLLSSFISPHQFWLDTKRWLQAIEYAISSKISNSKEIKDRSVLEYLNIFSSGKSFSEEKAEKVSAYIIISQFNFHMSKLKVPEAVAGSIITTSTKLYEIDSERTTLLLTELLSRSTTKLKLQTRTVKLSETSEFILKKSSKFLTLKEAFILSSVNKTLREKMKKLKYRKLLIFSSILDLNPHLRRIFWLEILNVKDIQIEYDETLGLIKTSKELIGDVSDIIDLDVVRCYQKSSEITGDNLSNILKVYAYKNKDIGYCQGMNYIAGTFYLILQDEEQSLKALYSLISTFKLNSMFNIELTKVKKLFFIFDRLIAIFLPELNETFKESWVFADNFSSSWLITLFSSVFHARLEVTAQIWDVFLTCGWKGIFKVSLMILKKYQESLFNKSFEEILSELNTLPSRDIFDRRFFQQALEIKVTNRLISSLKIEFKALKKR